jgi:hypothetical protein
VVQLPVQVGDEDGKPSPRGLEDGVQKRARLSAVGAGEAEGAAIEDFVAGEERVAELEASRVVRGDAVGDVVAETGRDLGCLAVVGRGCGRLTLVRDEPQDFLQAQHVR